MTDQAMKLTIIVPLLNEERVLSSFITILEQVLSDEPQVQVIMVDGGSSDNSFKICQNTPSHWIKLQKKLTSPSIGKGVELGIEKIKAPLCLILPVDVTISKKHIHFLLNLKKNAKVWGGFFKNYSDDHLWMKFYAWSLNWIRSSLLGHMVWTNVFFVESILLKHHLATDGFMEDVLLSDRLKQAVSRPIVSRLKVRVSSRRYDGKFLNRIWINLKIMLMFRLKFKTIEELKKIYRG